MGGGTLKSGGRVLKTRRFEFSGVQVILFYLWEIILNSQRFEFSGVQVILFYLWEIILNSQRFVGNHPPGHAMVCHFRDSIQARAVHPLYLSSTRAAGNS
jgi:hypothetical protein